MRSPKYKLPFIFVPKIAERRDEQQACSNAFLKFVFSTKVWTTCAQLSLFKTKSESVREFGI